jgi:hypothetical protein
MPAPWFCNSGDGLRSKIVALCPQALSARPAINPLETRRLRHCEFVIVWGFEIFLEMDVTYNDDM